MNQISNKIKKEFWKDWKNKTKLEKQATKSLEAGKKIILNNIPREEIFSIYVKGSFPRREMNEKSDVDIVVILKTEEYIQKLKEIEENYKQEYKPQIQFSPHSIFELKKGKNKSKNCASTSRLVKHLDNYFLIYGKPLDTKKLFSRSDEEDLKKMIKAFREIFLPDYKEKKFGFSEIVKQVFWLVENEEKVKRNNPPHNWKELADSIEDKKHIIHEALKLRLNPTKNKIIRKRFLIKLNKYLNDLDKKLK